MRFAAFLLVAGCAVPRAAAPAGNAVAPERKEAVPAAGTARPGDGCAPIAPDVGMKESDAFNRASFDRALSAAGLEPLELPRRLFDGLPSTTSPVTALYEPFSADGHRYIALERRADFGWDQQAPSPASGPLPRAETELVAIARDRQGKVWLVQRLPKYHCSRSHLGGCLALSGAEPRPYWVAFELPQGADLAGRRTIEYDASLVSQQYAGGDSCAGPAPP